MNNGESKPDRGRRALVKKAIYIAPTIVTLKAVTAVASYGSTGSHRARKEKKNGNNGVGNGIDPPPSGNAGHNDGPGSGPGKPGSKKDGDAKKGNDKKGKGKP